MSARDSKELPRLPPVWVLLRDIFTFLGGWALIFLEVSRPEIREPVLLFGGAMIGVPGFGVAFTALVESYTRRRSGIDDSPLPPAPVVELPH